VSVFFRLHKNRNNPQGVICSNETEIYQEDAETIELDDSGLFNVSSTLTYDPDALTDIFSYTCELNIPGTNFNLSETRTHDQENASVRHLPSLVFTVLIIALLSPLYL
jgi:hypothetical protein